MKTRRVREHARRGLWRHLRVGLRDRVILLFGLLGLVLTAALALTVWLLVSRYLVNQRMNTVVDEARFNAVSVQSGLGQYGLSVPEVMDRLATSRSSFALLNTDGEWYASAPRQGPRSLPSDLVKLVHSGVPATQRVDVEGQLLIAVGLPLDRSGDAYFELFQLDDLNRALSILSLTLVGAALAVSVVAMAFGRVVTRLALRPLAELTSVASAVARGDLGARLHGEDDPDLGGLARSFNHTADLLQRRVAADIRFAGDVSHELRTPLTTMLNSLELVQHRREELPGSVREPLDLLSEDLRRFSRLVVDLIDISRYDGQPAGEREEVRVVDLVRAAADATAGRPVTAVDPAAKDLVVHADKRRLERVVANLVENAELHGGGCLRVCVDAEVESVRIAVEDAGPGVPIEQRDRIFERFARTGPRRVGGVGLGLAIVASHVSWHGGRIWVEDREGGGARFVVSLPAEEV
ncbi:MAG TPA: HAMP domain-containing sensor histidine kinase [Nocardioidaceae bacterium]|jgi:signal transduction histidine kinase|nr:HAMP domain-containing sensor histidine kinase [Nocardioidaceae bacterium]